MRRFGAKADSITDLLPRMKYFTVLLIALCCAVILLSGCGIHVNINKEDMSVEEILANKALTADQVAFDYDGSYTVTFRYEEGGFEDMDLSQAYVAYFPFTVMDQVDMITGEDTEEIPPLPEDAQNAIDEVTGADQLEKIAVITIATVDDNTLEVSFTDSDGPIKGREYFFVIPNEKISGSVIPE